MEYINPLPSILCTEKSGTPAKQPEVSNYFSICYESLAAFVGSSDPALMLQRIHYWLQNNNVGYLLANGSKWVFFGYKKLQTQFPWLSIDQIGRIIRYLEKLGWLISDRFYNLKRNIGFISNAPDLQEDNQRKWYRLDYRQIYQDTGFDLLVTCQPKTKAQTPRTPRPNIQPEVSCSAPVQKAICTDAQTSIYKEKPNIKNQQQTDPPAVVNFYEVCQPEVVCNEFVINAPLATDPIEALGQPIVPNQEQFSEPPPPNVITKPRLNQLPQEPSESQVPEEIVTQIRELEIQLNPQLRKCLLSATVEVVKNAIAFVKQQKSLHTVRRPAGLLTYAIRNKLQPEVRRKVEETPGRLRQFTPKPDLHPAQYTPTLEFLEWYETAIASGWVENVEVRYLPTTNNGPLVRIPGELYPVDWRIVRAKYSDGEQPKPKELTVGSRVWYHNAIWHIEDIDDGIFKFLHIFNPATGERLEIAASRLSSE